MTDDPSMALTILGSGTAVPSKRRGAPGHLLRIGGDRIVFDTGPGTMRRLLDAGVTHDQVTHIFYSHNHLDHTGELAPWLFTSRIPASSRTAPLTLCGSSGFMRLLSALRDLHGDWLDATTYTLNLVTMDGAIESPLAFDGWSVQAFPVDHIESSLAYRITHASGRTFVYTGDTDLCEDLIPLARDADLLLIESSAPDEDKMPKHLTPSEAGQVASRAGARRVVLTHFYPACDEVDMMDQLRRTYTGEALLAEDGLTLEV